MVGLHLLVAMFINRLSKVNWWYDVLRLGNYFMWIKFSPVLRVNMNKSNISKDSRNKVVRDTKVWEKFYENINWTFKDQEPLLEVY